MAKTGVGARTATGRAVVAVSVGLVAGVVACVAGGEARGQSYWIGGYAGNDWMAANQQLTNPLAPPGPLNPLVTLQSNWGSAPTTSLQVGASFTNPYWLAPQGNGSNVIFAPLNGGSSATFGPVLNTALDLAGFTVNAGTTVNLNGTGTIRTSIGLTVAATGSLTTSRGIGMSTTPWTASIAGTASLDALGVLGSVPQGTMIKAGAGTLTLRNPASVAGWQPPAQMNVTTGTLELQGDYGAAGMDVSSGAVLRVSPGTGSTWTLGGGVTGAGQLRVGGLGRVIIPNSSGAPASMPTGGIFVEQGTLQLGNSGSGSTDTTSAVTIASGATLDIQRVGSALGAVGFTTSGGGRVVLSGTGGVTMTGAWGHTGGTFVEGTFALLSIGNGGATGSIAGPITLSSGRLLGFNRSDVYTVDNTITGGQVSFGDSVAGTAVLTGSISSESITVFRGTLRVGNGSGFGSGGVSTVSGPITLGANLFGNISTGRMEVNFNGDRTFASTAGPSGELALLQPRRVTFTGGVGHNGPVSLIAGSTLQVNGNLTAGMVSNAGTVELGATGAQSVSSPISGAGAVVKSGAGTTTFTGSWTHTGGTTINAGLLQSGGNGSLPANAVVSLDNSAGFSFNRAGTFTQSGSFAMAKTSSLSFDNASARITLASTLTGPSTTSLNQRAGATTLTGNNSGFAGGINVSGGTLEIGGNSALGSGTVTLSGGTIRASGAERFVSNPLTLAGNFTLGRLTQLQGIATLTNNVTVTLDNPDGPANGFSRLSNLRESGGSRSLTIVAGPNGVGTGGLRLLSPSTHTGGTTIATRVEVIADSLGTGPVSVTATGQLNLNNDTTVFDLRGDAGGVVANNGPVNTNLTINGSGDSVFAGQFIAPLGTLSPLRVTRAGTGTTTLTGDSTSPGVLTVSSGLLRLGNGGTTGSWAGSIVNNATLDIHRASGFPYNGTVTGTGIVRLFGDTHLSGDLANTGGTVVDGWIRVLDGGRINGPVSLANFGARLESQLSAPVTWSNAFSGSGQIRGKSAGPLELTGDLSAFTGTVMAVDSGRVVLASPAPSARLSVIFSGTITLTATGTLVTPGVSLSDGGRVVLAPGGQRTLRTPQLTIAGAPVLDLTDNFLVLEGIPLATATANLAAGRIGSSLAGTGSGRDLHTAVGALANTDTFGLRRFSTFGGTSVSATDTLLRYTYRGDTDFNGTLDARDFNAVLSGLTNGRTGWENGDVNHDGVVNMTDWSQFLAAYAFVQSGGAPFGDPTGAAAIPEPATAAALLLTTPLLLRRRRQA